ncbi:MAG: GntR family transcriptional regulator [Planctomycetota bacterium]
MNELEDRPTADPTLTEQAYRALRSLILSGAFEPGERLVNRTLAKDLKYSFTPIRESIRRLASEGLIDYRDGVGAFVRIPDRDEIEELYDLREAIEPMAAARAAKWCRTSHLTALDTWVDAGKTLAQEIEESSETTVEQMRRGCEIEASFHGVISEACRNRWVEKISHDLHLVAHAFAALRGNPEFLTAEVAHAAWKDHADLVEKLRDGDGPGAEEWMRNHIRTGRANVLSFLEQLAD